jgi:2-phosphoglycerate kinase
MVIGPEGPRPFMRGILVHSLVSRGVPFEVAFEAARKIKKRLPDRGNIERQKLAKLVADLLGDRYTLDAPSAPPRPEPLQVLDDEGSFQPFSKGILAVSLQGAGLDPSDAYDVARELEDRLVREGRWEIRRGELRELVAETIERTHGDLAAERYWVWHEVREVGRPIFLLLGGSTGVGKTSVAVEVAQRLDIARVHSTDLIRQIMRLMFSPDLMPEIHCSMYEVARVLKPELRLAENALIIGLQEQAQKVAVGVHGLLDRAVEESTSLILEGGHLLPGVIDVSRYAPDAHVVFEVVATLDREAHRKRFSERYKRAPDREPARYLRHFDEIIEIQDYILEEADRYGVPIIDNVHRSETILSVIRSVLTTIQKPLDFRAKSEAR